MASELKSIRVAAGILLDAEGRILVSERLGDPAFPGYWEFPGGKIGEGEAAADALCRELAEELGIEARDWEFLLSLEHRYPDRQVSIDFFIVSRWAGVPAGLEGQAVRWVTRTELGRLDLLPADAPVIEALRVPG
ncbi:MAG: 8-oxo-dGTP diphosphatase MutT [Gammaproteobacteria bacterium]|nr:8-oxo-dGTP diphosphatase MutT [Gammaproteobacteria bacterium]MDH4253803.1 8-oxo-dGTP diphosphatase MutT [Gammaproteobacteria bacterium]MDH5308624.1 8-oxo-dGTP diphosphatase MutT [Gammaproteobacteria bacterium]